MFTRGGGLQAWRGSSPQQRTPRHRGPFSSHVRTRRPLQCCEPIRRPWQQGPPIAARAAALDPPASKVASAVLQCRSGHQLASCFGPMIELGCVASVHKGVRVVDFHSTHWNHLRVASARPGACVAWMSTRCEVVAISRVVCVL